MLDARIHNVHGATKIDFEIVPRIIERADARNLPRNMQNCVEPGLHQDPNTIPIAHVEKAVISIRRNIGSISGRLVVDYDDRVTPSEEGVSEMAADEARAASHQNPRH
jgi:hypothetical protein